MIDINPNKTIIILNMNGWKYSNQKAGIVKTNKEARQPYVVSNNIQE